MANFRETSNVTDMQLWAKTLLTRSTTSVGHKGQSHKQAHIPQLPRKVPLLALAFCGIPQFPYSLGRALARRALWPQLFISTCFGPMGGRKSKITDAAPMPKCVLCKNALLRLAIVSFFFPKYARASIEPQTPCVNSSFQLECRMCASRRNNSRVAVMSRIGVHGVYHFGHLTPKLVGQGCRIRGFCMIRQDSLGFRQDGVRAPTLLEILK